MKSISKSKGFIYGNPVMEYPMWTSNTVYLLGFYIQAGKFHIHFQCLCCILNSYGKICYVMNHYKGEKVCACTIYHFVGISERCRAEITCVFLFEFTNLHLFLTWVEFSKTNSASAKTKPALCLHLSRSINTYVKYIH